MMTKLKLISQNCSVNYSTQIPSELILQVFMLGECFGFLPSYFRAFFAGVEKNWPVQFKGRFKQGPFALTIGSLQAVFLLSSMGLWKEEIALKKGNLPFKRPFSKTILNRTTSVFSVPIFWWKKKTWWTLYIFFGWGEAEVESKGYKAGEILILLAEV